MSPRMSSPWHLHVTSIGDAVQDISRMQVNANLFKSVQMFVVFLAFSTNAQTQLQLKSRENMHGPYPRHCMIITVQNMHGPNLMPTVHAWANPHAWAIMIAALCMPTLRWPGILALTNGKKYYKDVVRRLGWNIDSYNPRATLFDLVDIT